MLNFNLLPHDKALHYIGGTLIAAVTQALHGDPIVTFAAVSGAAVGKEIYDYLHRDLHTPDVWDAIFTLAGGSVVLIGDHSA